jgi:signal transduction histidine kinase
MTEAVSATVLLVDDDAALLDALPELIRLRLPGVAVVTAESALDALDRLEAFDFDAMISDIKMPGMDGIALVERANAVRPAMPAILITGHGQQDLLLRALRAGARDFVQKPIDRDYFVLALENALVTRGLRREVEAQRDQLRRNADELAEQVRARTRQLQIANEAKDEFLAMISHEMRTPLTILNGGVSALARRAKSLDAQTVAELLADMRTEGERLARIVEDLLTLARAELQTSQFEPIAIERVLGPLVADARQRSGRAITLSVAPDVPLVVGDDTYIERVVSNLLNNSEKYSRPGTPIDVMLARENDESVVLAIRDQGEVFTPQETEAFLQRFVRGAGANDRARGTGIGLTVCERLVTALGGELRMLARAGGGLEARVLLPAYTPTSAERETVAEAAVLAR